MACDPQTGGPKVFIKADGNMACAFEIVADTVRLLTYDEQQMSQLQQQSLDREQVQPRQTTANREFEDDIPF